MLVENVLEFCIHQVKQIYLAILGKDVCQGRGHLASQLFVRGSQFKPSNRQDVQVKYQVYYCFNKSANFYESIIS